MTDSSSSKRQSTIHSIQLLRAIAALIVALYHSHFAFSSRTSLPVDPEMTYLFGIGPVGVHVFFVISGFIMVYVTRPETFDLGRFLRRRALRIYPIYWICAALYLTYHTVVGPPYSLSLRELIGSILLFPGEAPKIIGPAWTLTYEIFFYASFGLAMTLGRSRGLIALFVIFGTLIVGGMLYRPSSEICQIVTNPLLLEFLSGTAIGWLYVRGFLNRKVGWFSLIASVILYGSGFWYGYDRGPSVIIWGIPSALLVLGLVAIECNSRIPSPLKRLGNLGDSSYALYLIHILVITVGLDLAGATKAMPNFDPIAAALALGFISLAVGEILHRMIERPLLALLKPNRKLARR